MSPVVRAMAIAVLLWATVLDAQASASQADVAVAETIARIQVHGNNATPDADVLALAGVAAGDPFTSATIDDVRQRLARSGRFENVTVLKRYASIADLSQVVLVVVVDEHAVSVVPAEHPGDAAQLRRRGWRRNLMFLPVVDAEDGYGLTYGARVAYVNPIGPSSRLSFPLTWGGTKTAGAELERTFHRGPVDRVLGGGLVAQRHNPAYEIDDTRRRLWARAERVEGPVRVGGTVDAEQVSFGGVQASLRSATIDATLDTRRDPAFPRNAVYARAAWTRRIIDDVPVIQRKVEATGYLGFLGSSVLVGRVSREDADAPLPPYLRPLLGGWSNLRGFSAGAFSGDIVVSGSAEVRVPLSSPLRVARVGVNAFIDAGRAYDYGESWNTHPLRVGAGAGVWVTATILRLGVSVAHGRDADTRVNFGAALGF